MIYSGSGRRKARSSRHKCPHSMDARKEVNIRDVARLAGVSPTTVSHALNGKRPVSQATRRRVRDAAERLGYRPHPGARSLKAGGTGVIMLCAVNVSSPAVSPADLEYYYKLIKGVTEATYGSELALVLVPESESGVYWDRLLLDGAIVADPVAGDRNIGFLRARHLPYVTIGRDPDPPTKATGSTATRGRRRASCSTTSPPGAPATSPQ